MSFAARQDDPIQHSMAFAGLLGGLIAGAAIGFLFTVGAPIVLTGAAAFTFTAGAGGAALGALFGVGAGIGAGLGELFFNDVPWPGDPTGAIETGSPNVLINDRPAAGAELSSIRCDGTPPLFVGNHDGDLVADGALTVYVNRHFAARVGDRTECGAQILEGSPNVYIGGPGISVLKVWDEVPWWFEVGYGIVGCLGATLLGGIKEFGKLGWRFGLAAVLSELVCQEGMRKVGSWAGGLAFGEGTKGQEAVAIIFAEVGGELGSRIFTEDLFGSGPRLWLSRLGMDPVDLGSGRVVEVEVDLELPGAIPLSIRRIQSSACAGRWTGLGVGGWSLSLEQSVLRLPGRIDLRDGEGRSVHFPPIPHGQSALSRGDRLVLTALEGGAFEVLSLETRLTRAFAPLGPGEPAVLRAIRDASGNAITFEYSNSLLSRVVDTAGREIRIRRGTRDLIARLEVWLDGQLAQRVSYRYSAMGHLTDVMDALGQSTRYRYDDQHRLVEKVDRSGVAYHYEYDERTGWCRRAYGDGDILAGEIAIDPDRRVTFLRGDEPRVLHWDERGLVVREETPDGALIGAFQYDEDMLLVAETNSAGETTRYEYDARGNRVAATDPAGNVTTWEYERDLPKRRLAPGGLETRFLRDERGALRAVIEPSGRRVTYEYDERGRLVAMRDDLGPLGAWVHDERHQRIAATDARGAVTRIERDALGRPLRSVDALGRAASARLDALGRPVQVELPGGAASRAEYDALGRPTRVVDALGRSTRVEYAGALAPTKLTRPDGVAFTFEYTPSQRLRRAAGPRGEAHEYEYDSAGRLIRESTFDGRALAYRWSALDRLARIDSPDGSSRSFFHDRLGRLTGESSPDGELRYERDAEGRLLGAVARQDGREVSTRFERDRLGRVVAEHQGGRVIRFAYDARGRRVERALPDGSVTRYGHDAADDLAWVEHGGLRLEIERDALGRITALHGGGGSFSLGWRYDEAGFLVEQRLASRAAGAGARRVLHRDAAGQLLKVEDDRWGVTELRRDAAGRLVEARRGRRREAFAHDASGALVRLGGAQEARGWEMASGGLLIEAGRARYEHDARGRRVRRRRESQGSPEVTQYVWDSRDRLREVLLSSGARVRFVYDAFGRRVRRVIEDPQRGQRITEYLWDGAAIAAEIDGGGLVRAFVHAPGSLMPLLHAEAGEVFACGLDPLGAPAELVDRGGRVAWAAARGVLGDVVQVHRDPERARPVSSPFGLPGQWRDEETGLAATYFRFFDAEVGRFCSPDPIGLAGGMDLFGLNADPTTHVDVLGLSPIPSSIPSGTPIQGAPAPAPAPVPRGVPGGADTVPIGVQPPQPPAPAGPDPYATRPIRTGYETVPIAAQPPTVPAPASPDPAATVPLEIIGGS